MKNFNAINHDDNFNTDFRQHIMDIASFSSSYKLYRQEHFFNEDFFEQFGFLRFRECMRDFQRMIDDLQIPVSRIRRYKETLYYIDWESGLEIHD